MVWVGKFVCRHVDNLGGSNSWKKLPCINW